MSTYSSQYFKLLRSGFLNESYKFLALAILVFIVLGSKISAELEIIIFTFLGMGILSDLDEKRYTLASSIPMKVKTRISMLYINTYVICILGGAFRQLAYLIRGEARTITETLIVILTSVIGCSIYYLAFASNEFKEDPQEQVGLMIAFVIVLMMLAFILLIINWVIKASIISTIIMNTSLIGKVILVGILIALTLIINKISYKNVIKKVLIIN